MEMTLSLVHQETEHHNEHPVSGQDQRAHQTVMEREQVKLWCDVSTNVLMVMGSFSAHDDVEQTCVPCHNKHSNHAWQRLSVDESSDGMIGSALSPEN